MIHVVTRFILVYFCRMMESKKEHKTSLTVFEEFLDDFAMDTSKLPQIGVEERFAALIPPLFD